MLAVLVIGLLTTVRTPHATVVVEQERSVEARR